VQDLQLNPENHQALYADVVIQGDRLCGPVVRVPGYRSRSSGFDSRRYRIFWEAVGLERDPLSLVSTIEDLLERKSSGSGLESREYGHRDPSRWPLGTLYPQKLALASPTSDCRSVGIVRSWTQATELVIQGCRAQFNSAKQETNREYMWSKCRGKYRDLSVMKWRKLRKWHRKLKRNLILSMSY
jgi:hypothetical protein